MNNLDKLRQLSRKEQGLLIQSVLLLPVLHVGLLFLGFYRLRRAMERLIPILSLHTPISEMKILRQARAIARIVSIAAQHSPYKAGCLRRSLLVWWFLRRDGIQSQLCFGVRMFHGKLEAHAWVEHHGIVLNDSSSVRQDFQPLHEVLPSTKMGL